MLITRDVTKKSEDRTNLALVSKFRSKLNDLNAIKDITLRQLLQMQETAADMKDKVEELHDDLVDDLNDVRGDLSSRGVSGKDGVINTIQELLDEAEDELDDISKGIDVTITCLNVCQTCNTGEASCTSCNANDGDGNCIINDTSGGQICGSEDQQALQCIYTKNYQCTDENQGTGTVINTCEACHGSTVTTTPCTPTSNGKCSSCNTSQTTTCESTADSEDYCDSRNEGGTLCDNYNTSGNCLNNNSTGDCWADNIAGECNTENAGYTGPDEATCGTDNTCTANVNWCFNHNTSGDCYSDNTTGNCYISNDSGSEIESCTGLFNNSSLCETRVGKDGYCSGNNTSGNCVSDNSTGDCVNRNNTGTCATNDNTQVCQTNNPPGTTCTVTNSPGTICYSYNTSGDCLNVNSTGDCDISNNAGDCNASNGTGECATQGCSECQTCLTCQTSQEIWNCDGCISGLAECTGGASTNPTTWEEEVPISCITIEIAGIETLSRCAEIGDNYQVAVNACGPGFTSCSNVGSCDYARFGSAVGCSTGQGCGECNANNTCANQQTCSSGQSCSTCNTSCNTACLSTSQCGACQSTSQTCTSDAETCTQCYGVCNSSYDDDCVTACIQTCQTTW